MGTTCHWLGALSGEDELPQQAIQPFGTKQSFQVTSQFITYPDLIHRVSEYGARTPAGMLNAQHGGTTVQAKAHHPSATPTSAVLLVNEPSSLAAPKRLLAGWAGLVTGHTPCNPANACPCLPIHGALQSEAQSANLRDGGAMPAPSSWVLFHHGTMLCVSGLLGQDRHSDVLCPICWRARGRRDHARSEATAQPHTLAHSHRGRMIGPLSAGHRPSRKSHGRKSTVPGPWDWLIQAFPYHHARCSYGVSCCLYLYNFFFASWPPPLPWANSGQFPSLPLVGRTYFSDLW